MNHYAYIIMSEKTGMYYTGSTSDLRRRVYEHNNGKVRSTRKRGLFKLVYFEEFASKHESYRREMEIKRYKGGNAFKKLLESEHSGIV